MGIPTRELLRQKGTPYEELGLGDPSLTDDQLLNVMMAHPILINRPIVMTPLGVKLCRLSEAVLDILLQPQRAAFTKEDGEKGCRRSRPLSDLKPGNRPHTDGDKSRNWPPSGSGGASTP